MNPSITLAHKPAQGRVDAIDLLRGLVILVMLFVNDLATVGGAPAWLKHIAPPEADGMTLADAVFPAFLFIVGLSMPIAFERRLGLSSLGRVLMHICIRTASLLVIGIYMVNSEQLSAEHPLYRAFWSLLVYAGVVLVWLVPRRVQAAGYASIRRWTGMVLLVVAAMWYRNPELSGWFQLRPHWWGILGLIGWAYLVSSVVHLLLRRNPAAQVGVIGILYCVYFADRAGYFSAISGFDRLIDIGSMLGSLPAITLSGAVAGQLLFLTPEYSKESRRIVLAIELGLVLAVAGLLLHALHAIHPMFIINKIAATPAWCLLSSAFTLWLWAAIHLLTAAGLDGRPRLLADAGRNALLAFIAGPILYALFDLLASLPGNWRFYSWLGSTYHLGLWRSLVFALTVTTMIGWLWRRGWTLKL